ncbi:hypothetical protein Zm00014a_007123 [Zea mays]|uniref:Uncharacterized protein n=1 Tax=Zea mays TaxID=4577 RepID=A0A3L6ESE9_MAIZE|nr:hypothetical protein Zm00014a_007123 [Zea mays]
MAADQPSALPILLLARVPCSSAPWMQPLLTMDALPSSSDGARVPDTQDSPRPSASAFPSAPFTIGHGPLGTLRAWHFSDPSSRSRGASPCHLPPMDAQKNPPCRRPFFSLTRSPSRNSSRVFFLPLLSTACSKQGAELHLPLMAGHSRGSPRLSSQAQPSPMARCSRCRGAFPPCLATRFPSCVCAAAPAPLMLARRSTKCAAAPTSPRGLLLFAAQ